MGKKMGKGMEPPPGGMSPSRIAQGGHDGWGSPLASIPPAGRIPSASNIQAFYFGMPLEKKASAQPCHLCWYLMVFVLGSIFFCSLL